MLNSVSQISAEYGLNINSKKTKSMTLNKNLNTPKITLRNDNDMIENVPYFCYLGARSNEEPTCLQEINTRIEIVREVFKSMNTILCSNQIHIKIHTRLFRYYVFL